MRGKFVKDWNKLNEEHKRKQQVIQKQKEKLWEEKENEQGKYWDPTRPTKRKKKEPQKKQKQKADMFQEVFKSITKIIRKLWLERNVDRHRLKRIAKITEVI